MNFLKATSVSLFLGFGAVAQALDLNSGPFAYSTSEKSLTRVMNELSLALNTDIDSRPISALNERALSGAWSANSIRDFLNQFSSDVSVDWMVVGEELVFVPTGAKQSIEIFSNQPERSAKELEQLARSTGRPDLFQISGGDSTVNIAGPAWYLVEHSDRINSAVKLASTSLGDADSMLTERLNQLEQRLLAMSDQRVELMIFPLKHAWVDDKTFSVAGQSTQIPGVASLFADLTGARKVDALVSTQPAQATSELQDQVEKRAAEVQRLEQARNQFQPTVTADIRTNSLIVRDFADRRPEYEQLIELLDKSTSLVQLEAYIVDVNRSKLRELGIGFEDRAGSLTGSLGTGAVNNANLVLDSATGTQLLTSIRFLETTGDTQIMSVPSVLAINNNEAVFSSRETFYVSVTSQQDAQLVPVTAETRLRVTAMVSDEEDPDIRLLINVQDSSIDGVSGFAAVQLPRTVEYQVSTQAVVGDGETILIGGQVIDRVVNSESRVPGISRVPLFGRVFRSESEDARQFLRLFLIKPTVIRR